MTALLTVAFLLLARRALFAVFVTGINLVVSEYSPEGLKYQTMRRFFLTGRAFLTGPQNSILGAAFIIMVMVMMSSFLGVIRLRVFAHFFIDEELSLLFAAFRLPDLVFQLLAFGIFSSAFIPIFTKTHKHNEKLAFETAAKLNNIALFGFVVFGVFFAIFAKPIYSAFAPGYTSEEHFLIASLSRILIVTQGFFVVSYIMTGILESLRRFFISALAPIFYNVGIIFTTVAFADDFHLYAPAVGAMIGAFFHLAIQFPTAYRLGFRFLPSFGLNDEVRRIGRLAAPRIVELVFLQASKLSELFFTSIIATASLTYYTFADSVRVMPITLFGVSLAKAALPTLASAGENRKGFKKTFLKTLYQISFLVMPVAAVLIVLRIPIVRLLFGAKKFDWEATIQTSLTLSVFALSIPFQSAAALLSRAFYARHNTKTPVKISILGVAITVALSAIFVMVFGLPTWSLALAYTLGMTLQATLMYFILSRELNGGTFFAIMPIVKSLLASLTSGAAMFFVIKFFDRSVWIKRLSFLTDLQVLNGLDFESFVIDTRYTGNLLILTVMTAAIGGVVYLATSFFLRSDELRDLLVLVRRRAFGLPKREEEPITRTSTESAH
jgi:putative peptidoglycan lipid II flippase